MGWKLQLPKLIRHRSVQAQSDWLYEVTITHMSITIIMTLHHITFVRCLVLLIPANLMTSNLRFGELLLSVGQCSRFVETWIVAYHFKLWTQLPSITTGRRAPLDISVTDHLCFLQYYDGDILTVKAESIQQCCHSFFRHGTVKIDHNLQFCDFDSCYYFIWVTLWYSVRVLL